VFSQLKEQLGQSGKPPPLPKEEKKVAKKEAKKEEVKEEAAPVVEATEAKEEAPEIVAEEAPAVDAEEVKKEVVEKAPKAKAPKAKAPKAKATKAAGGDDLKKIEGVGPKSAEILTEAGIATYAKLAESTADEIREVLAAAGNRYKSFDPTTWPQQAGLAAEGKWDELKVLQDELDGGKKK